MGAFVRFEEVCKTYQAGETKINAADGLSFEIEQGEICVIVGPSGAGKTTVLNLLGGMDSSDRGLISVDGKLVSGLSPRQLTLYRRHELGFVFQFYNLVQNLTALENVELARELSRSPLPAEEILEKVGLAERKNHFPAQLSGGEQQRVSIARALAKNPKILLCDEPTGALDEAAGKQILKLLQESSRDLGRTVVLITHNTALTAMADRVIRIKNGRVAEVSLNKNPTPVERIEW